MESYKKVKNISTDLSPPQSLPLPTSPNRRRAAFESAGYCISYKRN